MKYTSHKKIIPYHSIINLQKDFDRFDSFDESFHSLLTYFSLDQRPSNPESVDTYYLNQLILADLYQDYRGLSEKFRAELRTFKEAPSIKPVPFNK